MNRVIITPESDELRLLPDGFIASLHQVSIVSLLEKLLQLVITDATGTILWLVGLCTDNRFRVTHDTTVILRLTFL